MSELKYPVNTVIKAIEVINFLAKERGNRGVSISELSQGLEMNKSSVHRLLSTLQYYGYIDKNSETNRYRLGWELYKIGQVIPMQNQLYNIDSNYLLELNEQVHETVNLGILKKNETIILSKIEGPHSGLRVTGNPDEYEAIHATALGKMMISEMSEEDIRNLLNNEETLTTYTPNTISNVTALIRELGHIRELGYAVDAEEYCLGLYCMAMPIRDFSRKIICAVSVSTPTVRIDDAKKALILEGLKKTTDKISKSLGYSTL